MAFSSRKTVEMLGTQFLNRDIRTFTLSAHNQQWICANGLNTECTLFSATSDFGNKWEIINMEDSPSGIQVSDMVSVIVKGQEVLYFGTNKGVYSYRFKE